MTWISGVTSVSKSVRAVICSARRIMAAEMSTTVPASHCVLSARGECDDLLPVALDALAMEGRCGDAACALMGFSVGGDQPFAEQNLHALLRAVFAEGSGLVDEDFADVGGIIEQDHVVEENAVVCGAAESAQVLEEQDGIARLEEFAEEIKRQVHPQAGRI